MNMTETILVTDSTGNIGSEIIKQLSNSKSDINLKAAVRSEDNRIKNGKDLRSVQQVELDFSRPVSIAEGLKNVDKLFILTPTHPDIVEFTSNLVDGAKGVKHVMKLSHIRAEAKPGITITRLHREAEKVDLTGPESLTCTEAAEKLSTEAGKRIRYMNISEDQLREGIKEMGIKDWHANVIVELLRITRDGYVSEVSSAIEKVTGKKPISFSAFAKEYASDWK